MVGSQLNVLVYIFLLHAENRVPSKTYIFLHF